MSHELSYTVTDKKPGCRTYSAVMGSYEEAQSFLYGKNICTGSAAVRYEEPAAPVSSVKLVSLEKRKNECYKKWQALENHFHFENAKSRYTRCKRCGSSLSIEYLGKEGYHNGNVCPLCGEDLRPKSTLDRIHNAQTAYLKAREAEIEERKGLESRSKKKTRWLVMTDVDDDVYEMDAMQRMSRWD